MRGFQNKDSISSFDVKIIAGQFKNPVRIKIYYNEIDNRWLEEIKSDVNDALKIRGEKSYADHFTLGDILNALEEEFGIGNVDLIYSSIESRER